MRACPLLLLGLGAAACGSSGSNAPPLLAAATIGPAGGVLEVTSGKQAGLRLTVPPGALLAPIELRVRDVPRLQPPGVLATSTVEPPGYPFLLEPTGLRFEERATLRAPYSTQRIRNTAPGNVRAREVRNGNQIDYDPDIVDVPGGFVELPIRYLSQYQVVQGPVAQSLANYWQATGTSVELTDGWTFAVEEVPLGSPFQPTGSPRWRLVAPAVGTSQPIDLLYFFNDQLAGRESIDADWREVWSQPYPVWSLGTVTPPPAGVTMPMQVSAPMAQLPIGGEITVFGLWNWSAPRRVADRLLYDVVQLRISLAWNRADIGVGQREYMFWFAPGIGLVALSQDGVVHERTTL